MLNFLRFIEKNKAKKTILSKQNKQKCDNLLKQTVQSSEPIIVLLLRRLSDEFRCYFSTLNILTMKIIGAKCMTNCPMNM